MRLKYFVLPFLLVGFGCAASTPPASAPPASKESSEPGQARIEQKGEEIAKADTKEEKPENKDEPICKMEQVIGSNMRKRVCRTKEQMERERREAQELSRRAARSSGGTNQQ